MNGRHCLLLLAGTLCLTACSNDSAPEAPPVAAPPADSTPTAVDRPVRPKPQEPETADNTTEADRVDATFARLVRAHRNGDPAAWEQAEQQLTQMGTAALPTFTKALGHSDSLTREMAAMMAARLGPDVAPATDALLAVLDDQSVYVRANAAAALSNLPEPPDRVVTTLDGLLGQEATDIRLMAVLALGNLGPQAAETVDRLVQLVDEPDLKGPVIETLGRIGPAARRAIPALERLQQDNTTRDAATQAIRQVSAEQ